MTLKILSALNGALALTMTLTAATPTIGTVQASGEFRLNHSAAYGNATLFDGSLVETTAVRSDLTLTSGGRMALGPHSKTQVFKTYAVLQSGAADVNAPGYKLRAANLSISGSGAQVVLDSASKVRVGSASGPVEVRNSSDLLVAKVFPGHPLAFETSGAAGGQGGASGPVTITGTLTKQGDVYTVTDDTTNTTYQVQGRDLNNKVGKKVRVVGALTGGTAAGAVPVVAVTSVAVVGAAAVGAGLGTGVIAGIVVAGGAALGLGIAGATGAFSNASGG